MYIHRIALRNIRCIRQLNWTLDTDPVAGWHVIVGDNGAGKSTLLQAIALALLGPGEAPALRQDWQDWLSATSAEGDIQLDLSYDPEVDRVGNESQRTTRNPLPIKLLLERAGDRTVTLATARTRTLNPGQSIWGRQAGWFSAAYGPLRRFSKISLAPTPISTLSPRLAAHLSLFGEETIFAHCLQWLQTLQFKKLEKNPEGYILDAVKTFINQSGILPHQIHIAQISSAGIDLVDGHGCTLPIWAIGDGCLAVLSLVLELIRQLIQVYGLKQVFDSKDKTKVIAPGVVLIDEVEAHLHPAWQRQIGVWLRDHFPKLQFIVTTHSPLICQAATVGSVWRLPAPGSTEAGGRITGQPLDRLLYGNILDAYSTEVFGAEVSRSETAKQNLRRLAELNQKELYGQLTAAERREQMTLRSIMPTSAHRIN